MRNHHYLFHRGWIKLHPTNSKWEFLFFFHMPSSICFFDTGHPHGWEVISHWHFDLHFLDNQWCWLFLMCPLTICMVYFGEVSVQLLSLNLHSLVYFVVTVLWVFFYISWILALRHLVCKYFLLLVMCLFIY